MTRPDLNCIHEPFGDAFYFGPERLSARYADDEQAREESGFSDVTFGTVVNQLKEEMAKVCLSCCFLVFIIPICFALRGGYVLGVDGGWRASTGRWGRDTSVSRAPDLGGHCLHCELHHQNWPLDFRRHSIFEGTKLTKPQGKRVFIKDIIHYLFPPNSAPAEIAPSLRDEDNDSHSANGANGANGATPKNPTVIPKSILRQFHFTFLIRHPRRAIPSYYRCTVPPLDAVTGFYNFLPSEAGYDEVRRTFDYLRSARLIGPRLAGDPSPLSPDEVSITVVDADDLLNRPAEAIRAYCREVGLDFSEEMLKWEDEESQQRAKEAFEKWNGFHDDAIGSTSLKPRAHAMVC